MFGKPAPAPRDLAFVTTGLRRLCAAGDAAGCSALAGVYWRRDRARALAALTAACKLDSQRCAERERLKRREPYLDDLGPLPTLDVKPLADAARREHQR